MAAMELLPTVGSHRVVVVGNGAGACALGTDAMFRHAIEPARLSSESRDALTTKAPQAADLGVAIDIGRSDLDDTLSALAHTIFPLNSSVLTGHVHGSRIRSK